MFTPALSFAVVFGSRIRDPRSGIRDPGWVKIRIRDPGSGINIPDPQHCLNVVGQYAGRNILGNVFVTPPGTPKDINLILYFGKLSTKRKKENGIR